jgi:8-oxo-dGTP pyrophosphatase MutT (NUDIX family)
MSTAIDKTKNKTNLKHMTTTLTKHFITGNPLGNFSRKATTLILIEDTRNNYLFGEKSNFYPLGILRLIGGGLDPHEEPASGAIRELFEETGLTINDKNLDKIATITINATTTSGEKTTDIHLYYLKLNPNQNPHHADDISAIVPLTKTEFKDLINNFHNLTGTHSNQNSNFEWADYGQIFGYIHQIAYDYIDSK